MNMTGSRAVAFWASVLAGLVLIQGAAGVKAQETEDALADLTELPAMRVDNAEHSVQLAVARAGNRLVSVGERGIVLLSDDDGKSWRQASEVPVSVTLTDVEFVSDTAGWAVGHSGVVLKTESAGERWARVMTGEDIVTIIQEAVQSLPDGNSDAAVMRRNAGYLTGNEPLLDAYFSPSGESWLLGAYGIALRSDDGGQTWKSAFSLTGNPRSYHLYQFVPSKADRRLIVGERGLASQAANSSTSFDALETGYHGTFFGGVPLGSGDFLLFGLRGNVWMGGGDHWVRLETGSEASFSAAVLTQRGVVLGDVAGRLFLKTDKRDELYELTQASDAAITDMKVAADGSLVISTARGLKRLDLENTEFK